LVTRTEGDVRARLQEAALELFRERGYDRTTAAGIAARAGVTERTFFRHFPDKREVLFEGEATVRAALTTAIAEAPAGLGPLDTLFRAFRSFGPILEGKRAYAEPRHKIISATPALHERELAKIAALADVLADALMARGVADLRATLAASAGMAAFAQAASAWLDDPTIGLGERVDLAFRELKAMLAEGDQHRR
jgi:AcrR family transcriptional regulator